MRLVRGGGEWCPDSRKELILVPIYILELKILYFPVLSVGSIALKMLSKVQNFGGELAMVGGL